MLLIRVQGGPAAAGRDRADTQPAEICAAAVRETRKRGSVAASARADLELAGFGLYFESDSASIIRILKGRYPGFSSAARAGHRFEVYEAAGRRNPFRPAVLFDGRSLRLERGDFEAVLDARTGAGTLKAAPNEQCLDAFLRSLISSLLLRSGGFMLHSAGLVKNGRAYLFLGKSGAGKSTLSKLAASAGAEVISDEINLVRPLKGRFMVYGSPFWGEMRADGRPGAWPLGGIFLLGKARANRVLACTGGAALKLLLRCLVNFEKSPAAAGHVLENASRLLAKAKFGRLEFSKKDGSFLDRII